MTTRPAPRLLRQFAALLLAVFGGLAAWRLAGGQRDLATWGLAALGVIGGLGLARPAVVGPVYRAWMVAAFPVGWLVSRLLLALVYFLVFTPVALVFRVTGRDVLRRRRVAASSYWTSRPPVDDARRYFRQF